MLQIPFELLELELKRYESSSNGWNWHSNATNPVRMVGIGIRVLRIPFEWLELAFEHFECYESRSNGWNWHSNTLNPIRMVGIGI